MRVLLRFLPVAIVLGFAGGPAEAANDLKGLTLPEQAREVLRRHCASCHGPGESPRAGLDVLKHTHVADHVVKNNADASEMLQMVEAGMMPPGTRPKVPPEDARILRQWIGGGAEVFHPYGSDNYAYGMILRDVDAITQSNPAEVEKVRYVAFNHLLGKPDALDPGVYRAALARLLNLLSSNARMIRPEPIDPAQTIFRIRLDEFGWDEQPFVKQEDGAAPIASERVRIYDLLLLEYPYASIHEGSDLQQQIVERYLKPAQMLRPIAFVRGDWFIATAGLPVIYHDLLRLPVTLASLENKLEYKAGGGSARAGIVNSKEVRFNRILERLSTRDLVYWRTFDLPEGKGAGALIEEADKQFASGVGGSVVFSLKNGLPGFFRFGAAHQRMNAIPEPLVNEEYFKDKGVIASGLNCMQCHKQGMAPEPIEDVVRDAVGKSPLPLQKKTELLQRYPGSEKMTSFMKEDLKRFEEAFAQLPDQVPGQEDPLSMAVAHYLDEVEKFSNARVEVARLLGSRGPNDRAVAMLRDARKEELMERAIRDAHQGVPILPLDGLTHPQRDGSVPLKVDFEFRDDKDQVRTLIQEGDRIVIVVNNRSDQDIHLELFVALDDGAKIKLREQVLKAGEELRHPDPSNPEEDRYFKPTGDDGGSEAILYMSDQPFPPAILLEVPREEPAQSLARIVHPFYVLSPDGSKILPSKNKFDPDRVSKRTISFEMRKKQK